ncbi:MAG: dockerin type I domain-containing protein [Fimbriimonadales bacterium]
MRRYTTWFIGMARAAALAGLIGAGTAPAEAQRLIWLGSLPDGYDSEALGVSSQGPVVTGVARNSNGYVRAFRWTEAEGMVDIGTVGGIFARGHAISDDGQTIVGYSSDAQGRPVAFRWQGGTMQALAHLSGVAWSEAFGVSADGSAISGFSWWGSNFGAARWIGTTPQYLGTLAGAIASRGWGISADGQVVVGAAFYPSSGLPEARAVRWNGTTIEQLGALPGYRRSWAFAASQDGSVVVGYAISDDENGPSTSIRWVNGQPQNLGWLPLNNPDGSFAYGVSGDGRIVVGNSDGRAYRWTPENGMQNLNIVYASLLTDGSRLYSANAISLDGRYIVGSGYNAVNQRTEGFLLDTAPQCVSHAGDVTSDGCVDNTDLLQVLFAFGNSGANLGRVDVNCDGTVDDADLLVVLFNFGSGC